MTPIPEPQKEPGSEFPDLRVTTQGKTRRDSGAFGAIPASAARDYSEDMEPDNAPPESMADALARVGIVVTPEGKARAKKLLADAAAQRTPEALAQMRALVGLPPADAA